MKFGEQLKNERHQLGLTQEVVAEKLFVSRQTISSWETGRTYPDIDSLIALSQFYHISLDRLLKEDNGMVEDIRRKTALKESKMVLATSFMVNILLLGLVLLNMAKIKGFMFDTYALLLIVLIICGNLVITMYAKNKYLQHATKKNNKSQQVIKKWFAPVFIGIGLLLILVSRFTEMTPIGNSDRLSGLGVGFIVGAVIALIIQKVMEQFKVSEG